MKDLISKIKKRDISAGIMGLGYIGVPLGLALKKILTLLDMTPIAQRLIRNG